MTWKEALRIVNGLTPRLTMQRELSTDDYVLRKVCRLRREEPVAYDEILRNARIVTLDRVPHGTRTRTRSAFRHEARRTPSLKQLIQEDVRQ